MSVLSSTWHGQSLKEGADLIGRTLLEKELSRELNDQYWCLCNGQHFVCCTCCLFPLWRLAYMELSFIFQALYILYNIFQFLENQLLNCDWQNMCIFHSQVKCSWSGQYKSILFRKLFIQTGFTCSDASWTGIWSDFWNVRWSRILIGTWNGSETSRQILWIWTLLQPAHLKLSHTQKRCTVELEVWRK